MITDDHQCVDYPKNRGHLDVINKNTTNQFTRYTGTGALQIDRRLGIDYDLYHQLNMQAQKATVKSIDIQKRYQPQVSQLVAGPSMQSSMMNTMHQNSMASAKHYMGSTNPTHMDSTSVGSSHRFKASSPSPP